MDEERFILTRRGYERLRAELDQWEGAQQTRQDQLHEMTEDVDHNKDEEEAADFDAHTMKEFADQRVGHLKYVLERAQVIDQDPDPRRINVGDRVVVWDLGARAERSFNLVSGEEVGEVDDAVALDSPVGKALLGHTVGDTIAVTVPDGWVRYCVLRLERD